MAERHAIRSALGRWGGRGLSLSVSSAANVAFFFVRNIMLARLLGPENFGIAVAILTISAAVDVVSDLGWDKFLIQWDQKGNSRQEVQGVVHFLRIGLAVLMAAILVLISIPVAGLLGVPDAAAAIAVLAVPTLLRGGIHVDYKHRQRDLDFRGEAIVETSRSAIDLFIAAVAGLLLANYWAMTFAISGGALASFIASHAIARQPARPRWVKEIGYRILSFGAPLVVNNVLVYLAGQGDRLLVGMKYGVSQLATYGATLTLIAGPQAVLSRGVMMVALPLLSRRREDIGAFQGTFAQIGAAAVAACCVSSIPIILFGPELVRAVFGAEFTSPQLLAALLAVAQSLNILRTWAIGGLLAHSHTRIVPLANIARLAGFTAATAVAFAGGSLELLAACLVVGEFLGVAAALFWHSALVRPPPTAVVGLLGALFIAWTAAVAVQLETDSIALRLASLSILLATTLGVCFTVARAEHGRASRFSNLLPPIDESGNVQ